MRLFFFIVIFTPMSFRVKAQNDEKMFKPFSVFLGMNGGTFKNSDVDNYISTDAERSKWENDGSISDFTKGLKIGVSLKINDKVGLTIYEDYCISTVPSGPITSASSGKYYGNTVEYNYRRFSTGMYGFSHLALFHKFSAIAGTGISYNSIVFRKREVSSSVFASGLYANTIASTWTWGGHFRGGLGLRCTDWLALELCMYKDVLVPKKVNGLTLDYNIWGGDCTVRFSF